MAHRLWCACLVRLFRLFLPSPRVRTAFLLLAVCPSHRSLPPSPARVELCNGTGAQHGSPVCWI